MYRGSKPDQAAEDLTRKKSASPPIVGIKVFQIEGGKAIPYYTIHNYHSVSLFLDLEVCCPD